MRSLNFGGLNGWSYLSFGLGPLRFESFTGATAPEVAPAFVMTQNLGGGARWFTNNHIAFEIDVRFFLTRPQETMLLNAGADQRVLVISAESASDEDTESFCRLGKRLPVSFT